MNKLNHVAFIMDGNGRWGEKKNKSRNFGHLNGVKTVKKIVETSIKIKWSSETILPFLIFAGILSLCQASLLQSIGFYITDLFWCEYQLDEHPIHRI